MIKLRFLSSYVITILVTLVMAGLLIGISILGKITETVELTTVKLMDYEKKVNIPYVNQKLDEYEKQMAVLNLKVPNKVEAIDIVVNYAEALRQKFDAKAQAERPSEENGIVSLQMTFNSNFKSSGAFLSFLQELIDSNSPVVSVVSLKIDNEPLMGHKATFELKIQEPYMEEFYAK